MRLAVDAGNSRIKWSIAGGAPQALEYRSQDPDVLLATAWRHLPRPRSVHVACVAREAVREAIERQIAGLWPGVPVVFLSSRAECGGVRIAYARPERFGVDRLAALVAAHAEAGGAAAVVVDAGTAVTVDAMDSHGTHLGGLIMPGLRLLRRGLNLGTAGVRADLSIKVGVMGETALQANTEAGVDAGTHCMFIGGVLRAIDQACAEAGPGARVYLTGGDADLIVGSLARPHVLRPALVLEGVARMAEGE